MARNSDGLKASARSLKHWESSVKWLQEALNTGYKMNIRKASWMCLKSLEDFGEKSSAIAADGNPIRRKLERLQLTARNY